MTKVPSIRLNDGRSIPQLGFGTYQVTNADASRTIDATLAAGYRSIDTATIYANEDGVGSALRSSSVPRAELFITTKVWNDHHGYDATLRAFDESAKRLRVDYVDLYLIHWPVPRRDLYVETFRALVKLRDDGRAKSIGVSNFHETHLQRVIDETGVVPAVNQIELHPLLPQEGLREFHAHRGIVTESWSPLAQGELMKNAVVAGLAKKHGRTLAQIILRWHIELGLVAIPKSVNPARIRENIALFDFRLDADDMAALAGLDHSRRIGPDPEMFP